jgi:hypothetical protein
MQLHVVVPGEVPHVVPVGQNPPHVPDASAPHALMHIVPGPGQHMTPPAVAQMQTCSQTPSRQRSTLQKSPSSQSASVLHPCPGSVVVVVEGGGHANTQTCSSGHGAMGEHACDVHCPLGRSRQLPVVGRGHSRVQISFGWLHGWRGEQAWAVH